MNYIAIIHKSNDSDYGVSFPDFPGCITAGHSVDDAKDMAREALSFHIEGMIDDGDSLPSPSNLDIIMKDKNFQNGVAFMVEITPNPQNVRVNINVREDYLSLIDKKAQQAGMSRSAFLVDAALRQEDSPHSSL